jgi:multiple sugar transport system substrate-binding protein
MVYNKDLVKGDPPTNFDQFLAAAKAATTGGNYGFAYRATMAERGGMWYDLCNFVYGFGGRWSNDKGEPTLNSPEVVQGIDAYKRVYNAGVIPKGADAATYRRMFAQGKLAMEIDNGGVAANLATEGKSIQMGAAPSPFPHKAQAMILAPITVNANSKHQEAAATFLKWMLGAEPQAELQQIHGASSVATEVPRSAQEEQNWPWIHVYDEQTRNSVPPLPKGLETKAPEIQQIVVQQVIKVLQNGTDPQQAMDEAQKKAERLVSKK